MAFRKRTRFHTRFDTLLIFQILYVDVKDASGDMRPDLYPYKIADLLRFKSFAINILSNRY